jgi:hypothetical protein
MRRRAISGKVLIRAICLARTVLVSALSKTAVPQAIWPKPPAASDQENSLDPFNCEQCLDCGLGVPADMVCGEYLPIPEVIRICRQFPDEGPAEVERCVAQTWDRFSDRKSSAVTDNFHSCDVARV